MELPDDDIPLVVRALQHYADYLRATNRDGGPFLRIAEGLLKKEPQSETGKKSAAKRKA